MGNIIVPAPSQGIFRREDPIIERDGDFKNITHGGMWPSHRKWWYLPNKVKLLVGGYGAGKTLTLCKRHIELALAHSGAPTAIVSPTYSVAKKTVISTLEELLDGLGPIWRAWGGDLVWESRKTSPYEFRIWHTPVTPDGRKMKTVYGEILVYSGENPDKLKGPNLGSAGIDEPFIQDYAVFEQMNARVRHPKSRHLEINMTGTPEQLNWGYDIAEGELASKIDIGVVCMPTTENKALPDDFVPNLLRTYDPKAARAYVYGEFVNLTGGQVYYAFYRSENVVEMPTPTEGVLWGAGMDFNVNPMCATIFWYKSGNNPLIYFVDEIELPNSDTVAMCQEIRERYPQVQAIYPDSNAGRSTNQPGGKTDYDYIDQMGFEVMRRPANPSQRDRYNCVNGLLKSTGGRIRQLLSPKCVKLIKYQELYTHEQKHTKEHKAMSHLLDARDYPCWYLMPLKSYSLEIPVYGV